MKEKIDKINALKKEKNAVIMAHYYVKDEIHEVADYIGDSYFLSEKATQVEADTIILCGVSFMGEGAKILNQKKTVLMPDATADCPMAHMATAESIAKVREKYNDVAVVCYVNSNAELKRNADVCVTSSNALKIVKALPNKYIYFIPDKNLGKYVAEQVPEKEFIFNDGCCPVHAKLTKEDVLKAKKAHPGAALLVHPECEKEVVEQAEYVGSTAGIISYAKASDKNEFIIGTELGVMCELKKDNPEKKFYPLTEHLICPDMKKITLDKIIDSLENNTYEVKLEEQFAKEAHVPLMRMLELAK